MYVGHIGDSRSITDATYRVSEVSEGPPALHNFRIKSSLIRQPNDSRYQLLVQNIL